MDNTVGFGRLLGWISIVLGGALIAYGLLAQSPDGALSEYRSCESARSLGIRHAPCPPPASGQDKALLIGVGAGSVSSGVFFLLLSGILATLLEMREDFAAAERHRQQGSAAVPQRTPPRAAPAPERGGASPFLTTHLTETYGFAVGTRMHTEMQAAAARGQQLSEDEAKARAEAWIARQ